MIEYNKLVRDKIPEIIKSDGKTPVTHIATNTEYGSALTDKLVEEVAEFRESGEIEELADISEVLDAICELRGIDPSNLQRMKEVKAKEKGSFSAKIILDSVE